MMQKRKLSLYEFSPTKHDILLLDTNILIKLLYPVQFDSSNEQYELLYEKIKKAKSSLILSSIQLSEFINRCIRIQFSLYKDENDKDNNIDFKKEYRNTDDYRESMTAILDIVKSDIIPDFDFIDDEFSNMQSDKIFRYGFSYDFNDAVLVEIAKMKNAIIITNDLDFGNYGSDFTVVTSNRALLMLR